MSQQFINTHESAEGDKHSGPVWGARWTPTDQVITVSADGSLVLWEPRTAQVLLRPPRDPLAIISVSSPTGRLALYNTIVGVTRLLNLENGEEMGKKATYDKNADAAWSVSLHPGGMSYAAAGAKGVITVYSAQPESFGTRQLEINTGRPMFGMCVSYSPDGRRIAMSTKAGQILLCDAESGSLLATHSAHAACVRSVVWSADSQLIMSGSDDARLVLHDVRGQRGGVVATLSGHRSWILSADLSSDGRLAASGSADRTMKIWDLSTRACVSTTQETGEVWSVAWRPQGGALVSGGDDGVVRWWRGAAAG